MSRAVTGLDVDIVPFERDASSCLAKLHKDCFLGEEQWSEEAFAQLLSMNGTSGWGAYMGEALIGLLLVHYVAGEYEVLTLGVHPQRRGRGIGRALMVEFMAQVLLENAVIFLEVKVTNNRAFHLYSSLGFTQVGSRKRYYPDGEDARVLRFSSP
ncbi:MULTISPECIES: ribosomal protein S18-alanine N-acetyltransferase [unclassified Saccharibacter]|uniref:ribosomal protein S18-alanine N-acetyltransferase n=1 Tax=unclassified Saccharibacter TaxID=2648722 RepID=UPI0013277F82|nr:MULTISPECIES: ribosomal protein S18-alanine N-acetyltransferase [unclassified Saccharibacter]MXV36565.1 ribosomal protein S18-alanine N-acetyltransferase [Saccharibacter sp. EH611]MXV57727.1 ribosomal protein S18-alanine N-acetyltransferase [Saccharibacter sp. EH70]MXV64966.1 ribosomal protein S18-alanine N-acetyltransferase [Saccharibacter sp. EH60]